MDAIMVPNPPILTADKRSAPLSVKFDNKTAAGTLLIT